MINLVKVIKKNIKKKKCWHGHIKKKNTMEIKKFLKDRDKFTSRDNHELNRTL